MYSLDLQTNSIKLIGKLQNRYKLTLLAPTTPSNGLSIYRSKKVQKPEQVKGGPHSLSRRCKQSVSPFVGTQMLPKKALIDIGVPYLTIQNVMEKYLTCFYTRQDSNCILLVMTRMCSTSFLNSVVCWQHVVRFSLFTGDCVLEECVCHASGFSNIQSNCIWGTKRPRQIHDR